MKKNKRSYQNENWYNFSDVVKKRDGNKCLKCGRNNFEVVLQVHHRIYKPNLEPWEYSYSDCITLCKGCHARTHGLIEPDSNWSLLSINDFGDLIGMCERNGCGNEIRYEHEIYHPLWGYKSVGSTCVEYLTQEDQVLSVEILKIFKKISDFIRTAIVYCSSTKKGKRFSYVKYKHHQIRIYGNKGFYSYQIALKNKGENWYEFKNFINARNKTFEQVLELGFIVLRGLTTESEREKELLRNIYNRIK